MKLKSILILGAAASAAVIGVIAIPAIAAGPDGWGPGHMMQGHGGSVMRMQRGDRGAMGMGEPSGNPVYRSFDADADGAVSPAELEAGLAALLGAHDADGNGALSSEEFATLFAQVARGMAERPFAMMDADASGEVSAEELALPAQRMAEMQHRHGADADRP